MTKTYLVGLIALAHGFVSVSSLADCRPASEFRAELQTLWNDQAVFTNNYISSDLYGASDEIVDDDASKVFFQNARIGEALRPYWHDASADRLIKLLNHYFRLTQELVEATQEGDDDADERRFDLQRAGWSIAGFVDAATVTADRSHLTALMDARADLTQDLIRLCLVNDSIAEIAVGRDIQAYMLDFAAEVARATVELYPWQFCD